MQDISPWLGNLHDIPSLSPTWIRFISILISVVCGALVGLERERAEKPAGLRTVIMICLGSTIFTQVSMLMATGPMSDPARIAAQIVSGIGFLGAGAIIRSHGTIVGLTTGATIWAIAAVGMTIGCGHVAAGAFFTLVIYLTLTVADRLNWLALGHCEYRRALIYFHPEHGKTRIILQDILDDWQIPDERITDLPAEGGLQSVALTVCSKHRDHSAVLRRLVEVTGVERLEFTKADGHQNSEGDPPREKTAVP